MCIRDSNKGYTQGGSNADNVLADAYVKGIIDGVDWDSGYDAVVKVSVFCARGSSWKKIENGIFLKALCLGGCCLRLVLC